MADAAPQASSRIFISYRREDSSGHVLALLPALRRHFGPDRIFKDTDNIPPGADFVKFIRRELESCSVLLAIIGREWLAIQDPRSKRARLDNPDDFLRVEVGTALKNENIRVIPVLVERSSMPAAEDLPPDLTELAYRNAVELSDGRWDSDVQLLIQAIERATAAAAPADAPAPRADLLDLQKRRIREIAAHVTSAREALEAQDYEATLWACEKALLLDPQHVEALQILDRARKAVDEQKIAGWLEEAKQLLTEGDTGGASDLIDQALALDHASQAALTLRKEMLALRRERERERERARAVRSATERARSCFDDEDFDAAVRHADDALAADPQAAEAQEIRTKALAALDARRRQREHRRRAQQVVTDARAKFKAGDTEAALQMLRDFSPPHDLVTQAHDELKTKADVITTVHTRVEGMIARAVDAMEDGHFDDAIAMLAEAHGMEPGRPEIDTLLAQAREKRAAAIAAAAAREDANRMLLDASTKFSERKYQEAQQLVERARSRDPHHPETIAWLHRIEDAIEAEVVASRRDSAIRTEIDDATRAFQQNDLEAAIRHADAALAMDTSRSDARALRDRAADALEKRRAQEELDRRARESVARAKYFFAAKEFDSGIRLLEGFQPAHPVVTEALDSLRIEFREVERRRREAEEEAERQRRQALEAERARAEAARVDEEKRLAREREARERKEQERRAQEQRAKEAAEERARRAAAARAPDHEVVPEFRPATRRVAPLATAAVMILSAGAGLWYYSQLSREPASVGQSAGGTAGNRPESAPTSGTSPAPAGNPPTGATAPPNSQPVAPASGANTPPAVSEPAADTRPASEAAGGKPGVSPATAAALAAKEREARLDAARTTARDQVTKGQRSQALSTIVQGLRIDPDDRSLNDLLDELVEDAHQMAERAKRKAQAANASTLAQATFSQALKLEDDAVGLRNQDRKDPAARAFWRAAERFDMASQQASAAAEQARLRREEDERRRRDAANDTGRQKPSNRDESSGAASAGRGSSAPSGGAETKPAEPRPSSPAPTPPAPRPPSRADEIRRVDALLKQYESAHDNRDVDTIRTLFPAVQPDIVRRFTDFEFYRLDIVCDNVELANDMMSAVARCKSQHWFKPKGARDQRQGGEQIYTLLKRNDAWIITQVFDQRR